MSWQLFPRVELPRLRPKDDPEWPPDRAFGTVALTDIAEGTILRPHDDGDAVTHLGRVGRAELLAESASGAALAIYDRENRLCVLCHHGRPSYFFGSPSPAWMRPSAPRPTKVKACVTIG